MALVSGGRSTLNPDAPLFVPAAYRQVEDFSPEWWQLVTTSTWYRDYWLSQHQDEEGFYDNAEDDAGFDSSDVANLLPDAFEFDAGEDFSSLEVQFQEFVESYDTEVENKSPPSNGMLQNGFQMEAEAPKRDVSLLKALEETVPAAVNVNPN